MNTMQSISLSFLALAALAFTAGCDQIQPVPAYMTETQAAAACPGDEVVYVTFGKFGAYYVRRGDRRWGGGGDQASHNWEFGCRNELEQIGVTCNGWYETPDEFPGLVSLSPSCFSDWKPKTKPSST
jgi:hypothetical protein